MKYLHGLNIHIHIHIYIFVFIYIYIYIYLHIYIYVNIFICIYIFEFIYKSPPHVQIIAYNQKTKKGPSHCSPYRSAFTAAPVADVGPETLRLLRPLIGGAVLTSALLGASSQMGLKSQEKGGEVGG